RCLCLCTHPSPTEIYTPSLHDALPISQVILDAVQEGAARLTWRQDTFAYADSYDAAAGRYRGLEAGRRPNVQLNSESVVVKPEVDRKSTRLNSSHRTISYAVFCLKKKI